jgi:hypothetical protein
MTQDAKTEDRPPVPGLTEDGYNYAIGGIIGVRVLLEYAMDGIQDAHDRLKTESQAAADPQAEVVGETELIAALNRASHEVAYYLRIAGTEPPLSISERVKDWRAFCKEYPEHPTCLPDDDYRFGGFAEQSPGLGGNDAQPGG